MGHLKALAGSDDLATCNLDFEHSCQILVNNCNNFFFMGISALVVSLKFPFTTLI